MTDEAPIRLTQRRLGCSNLLMEVFLDDIAAPDGASVCNFIVLAPRQKTANLVTGVAVLPVLDGRFGLLKVFRHPIRDYTWEVPRGFVDADETPLTSALRELEEETGLQCDACDLIDLGMILPEPGIIAGRTHLFAATRCSRTAPYKANEMGHKELRFLSAEELGDMARQGIVEDANTLLAWYRYLQQTQL
jgi:ADP-ribose pyrophosphatase